MRRARLWDRWIEIVGWTLVIFGLGIALANQTKPFAFAFGDPINAAFWSDGAIPDGVERFQSWAYGVLGMVVAGWGVTIAYLARYPFRRRERWARDGLFLAVTLWFVPDTAISLHYHVYLNAAVNVVLVIAVYLPLAATRSQFVTPPAMAGYRQHAPPGVDRP